MNVEIWHFQLCGLSVHMVYKDAQCAPFVGGMHTHYRRGDHWSPATNKTVSFILHSPFRLAKSRPAGGCSLDAHCGGCIHFQFASVVL